jgi:hypothetical protein
MNLELRIWFYNTVVNPSFQQIPVKQDSEQGVMDVAFGRDSVGVIHILRRIIIKKKSLLVFRAKVKCPLVQSHQLFHSATKNL